MTAVDTNILFYVHDPREPVKQAQAIAALRSLDNGVLLWQVACEYLWSSRKLAAHGYSYEAAYSDIQELRLIWTTALPTWRIYERVPALKSSGFSHWDALLIGACLDAGVKTLISEDFSERTRYESLLIVNPFTSRPTAV